MLACKLCKKEFSNMFCTTTLGICEVTNVKEPPQNMEDGMYCCGCFNKRQSALLETVNAQLNIYKNIEGVHL